MEAARPPEDGVRAGAENDAAETGAGEGAAAGLVLAGVCAAFVASAALPVVDIALRRAITSSRELWLVAACAIVNPVASSVVLSPTSGS